MKKFWIEKKALEKVKTCANKFFPNETGGLLWGYQNQEKEINVVLDIIGPGPRAIHSPFDFTPDNDFHIKEIARLYKQDQTLKYLGDWHTHPNGRGYMSLMDKKTLKKISRYLPARLANPMMLILYGEPLNWKLAPYQLINKKTWWRRANKITSLEVKLF